MKLRHKINHGWAPDRTDPAWAERVEREAERTTDATEHAYRKAEERLDRALRRVNVEQARKKPDPKKVKRLWAAVTARQQELANLHALMRASPAGSQHRGKGSYRGVGTGEPL